MKNSATWTGQGTRKPRAWQIAAAGRKDYVSPEGIRVAPALAFLSGLI